MDVLIFLILPVVPMIALGLTSYILAILLQWKAIIIMYRFLLLSMLYRTCIVPSLVDFVSFYYLLSLLFLLIHICYCQVPYIVFIYKLLHYHSFYSFKLYCVMLNNYAQYFNGYYRTRFHTYYLTKINVAFAIVIL